MHIHIYALCTELRPIDSQQNRIHLVESIHFEVASRSGVKTNVDCLPWFICELQDLEDSCFHHDGLLNATCCYELKRDHTFLRRAMEIISDILSEIPAS